VHVGLSRFHAHEPRSGGTRKPGTAVPGKAQSRWSPVRDGTLSKDLIWFERHASLFQESQELVFVGTFGVVLGLMLNVIPDDWHVRRAHAECSVAFLPREGNPMLTDPA
jgi:hypothetical protein